MNQPIIVQGSLEHPMWLVLETNVVTTISFHNDFCSTCFAGMELQNCSICWYLINRPGLVGAVLQTAS